MIENIPDEKKILLTPLLIILILFGLRYPLLFLGEAAIIPPEFAFLFYTCFTYLFSGVFIVLYRKNLEQYNITKVALGVFFLAPIMSIIMGNNYDPSLWIRFLMAVVFIVILIIKRKDLIQISKKSVSTISINIILTLLLCATIPVLIHILQGSPKVDLDSMTSEQAYFDLRRIWFFQLSSAAICEEPLFRGFVWGYMRNKNIKSIWICLTQAGLFWLGHIYYIDTGLNFWIIHPAVAIILGLLVWKTKSITHTMVLHSSINTLTDYLRFIPLFK